MYVWIITQGGHQLCCVSKATVGCILVSDSLPACSLVPRLPEEPGYEATLNAFWHPLRWLILLFDFVHCIHRKTLKHQSAYPPGATFLAYFTGNTASRVQEPNLF